MRKVRIYIYEKSGNLLSGQLRRKLFAILRTVFFTAFLMVGSDLVFAANVDDWAQIRANDIAQTESGWAAPIYLGVNQYGGWIDSVEVSHDGSRIYYGFYPGPDLLTDVTTGDLKGDNDIYVSEAPFDDHRPVNQYFMNEIPWSACCVHRDGAGHFWYNSNREARPDGSAPGEYDWHPVFRNDELMPFNQRGADFGDVFYLAAKDELWMHSERQGLLVMKGAKADAFNGKIERAPGVIGDGRQPFLTSDGETLYFTANFGDVPSQGPAIYKVQRTADGWDKPTLVVWSQTGVGEPTLTVDGQKLFFVQLFRNEQNERRIAVFYIERKS